MSEGVREGGTQGEREREKEREGGIEGAWGIAREKVKSQLAFT